MAKKKKELFKDTSIKIATQFLAVGDHATVYDVDSCDRVRRTITGWILKLHNGANRGFAVVKCTTPTCKAYAGEPHDHVVCLG